MSDLLNRIEKLSPEKREFIYRKLREKNGSAQGVLINVGRKVPGTLPLSFAQQRLWFLDQLAPGNPVYNIPLGLRLRGPLNVEALEKSFSQIIARHETLRTSFQTVGGQPVQIIGRTSPFTLERIDLRSLSPIERERAVEQRASLEVQQPFDLSHGPLLRAALLHLSDEEQVLLLTMHHIISDGWSLGVLYHELTALYDAYANGGSPTLPALSIQYADFAQWQREQLQGERLEALLSYWQQQLAGAPQVSPLPTDYPRPAVQSFRGARQAFVLPASLTKALKLLSRQQEVTLFMTLLTAFQILLHRYSNQDDILVGTPIANRTQTQTEDLIGFFVNTLVLRSQLSGTLSFRELLGQVSRMALEAYSHQDLPFERLVEELHPERDLSYNPLVQVMFVLQNSPMQSLHLGELQLSPLQIESDVTHFDLILEFNETLEGGELRGQLSYSTDLFKSSTITRMIGHLLTLLEGIVAAPEQQLDQLPLLTEAERHQVLFERNDTRTDFPGERCIHQIFEAQVERNPDAVAVIFGEKSLTYEELNRRANQLGHHLRRLGVGPQVLVGLYVERSLEMLIGLLGIFKAGGAYVPLDPSYPAGRLAFMLQDAQIPVLLTQQKLLHRLVDEDVEFICLDSDNNSIAQESEENLTNETTTDDLAYVMYTSGSTGEPKGVAVPHRAINRLVCNTNYIDLRATDKVAQVSNASFDAATFEIWGALLHGAQLIGITKEVALSPRDFAAQLRDSEITVLFLTTALFNQLACEVPWAFASLRYLLFGGEAVEPKWVKEVLQKGAPEHLLHVYGPTENTTFTTWHLVKHVPEGATTIPIGRPIANTQVYILDKQQQPVPIGVPGELYIGGEGLARGYLNRPGLTNEYFVPHPFSDQPGARLYRSGDLGRYLPDGSIEFIGRADHQVKIRGFRIELEEIEAALNQHPAVQESVVIVREDRPGDKNLVGYVVARAGQSPMASELRSFVSDKLPNFMIPSTILLLGALPLTPNGKVDRGVLPAPKQARHQEGRSNQRPRTPVEAALETIWESSLGLDSIGIHENFFELGGHSLKAIELLSRIKTTMNVEVPLTVLFESPTIAGLAARIHEKPSALPSGIFCIQKGQPDLTPIFLIPGITGYVTQFWHLGTSLGSHPVFAIQGAGLDGEVDFSRSIEEMAAYYVTQIRKMQQHGPYMIIGYSSGGNIGLEIAKQLELLNESVTLGLLDSTPPHYFQKYQFEIRETFEMIFAKSSLEFAETPTHMSEEEMVSHYFQLGREFGIFPENWRLQDWQRSLDFWAILSAALEAYSYHPSTIQAPIHLFRATEEVKASEEVNEDYQEWSKYTASGLHTVYVPGSHDNMIDLPNVTHLAKAIITGFGLT
jgi:amino acid adenylation domain-containing protein